MTESELTEEIVEELESLQCIYGDNYKQLHSSKSTKHSSSKSDDLNILVKFTVTITADLTSESRNLECLFSLPLGYPSESPCLCEFQSSYDLPSSVITQLNHTVDNIAAESTGFPMIFAIVDGLQTEWTELCNSPEMKQEEKDELTALPSSSSLSSSEAAADATAAADSGSADGPGPMVSEKRILGLHAFKQNPKIFRQRCKPIIHELTRLGFDVRIPCAPIALTKSAGCSDPYCWFQYTHSIVDLMQSMGGRTRCTEYRGLCQTLLTLAKFCKDEGPFDCGILSFSQGSTLATLLCWLARFETDQLFYYETRRKSGSSDKYKDIGDSLCKLITSEESLKCGLRDFLLKYGNVFADALPFERQLREIDECREYLSAGVTPQPAFRVVLMSSHVYPLPQSLEDSYGLFIDHYCKDDLQLYFAKNDHCSTMDDDDECDGSSLASQSSTIGKRMKHSKKKSKKKLSSMMKPFGFPSLHLYGSKDEWVPVQQSILGSNVFTQAVCVEHNGAHVVPIADSACVRTIVQFWPLLHMHY